MALETGTYISDLVSTNPVPSDGLGAADDHMRLIKSTLKNTFAGFTAVALASSQAQIDGAVSSVAGLGFTRFPLGTAPLPGITPIGDPDSGIYSPGANQIAVAVNGAAQLTVTTTGVQVASNVVVTGGVATAAVVSTGAYSGGTGQLVSIGSSHIWHADTLPAEGGYCWANGGTLARATFPVLWALWGTKYGAGDGTTTFNVPNLCEVVPVGQRAMGGVSSRALLATGVLGNTTIGGATSTLVTANLPPYTPAGGINNGAITTITSGFIPTLSGSAISNSSPSGAFGTGASLSSSQAASTFVGSAQGGSSTPVAIVQPSMAVNFIIRAG